MEQASNNSQPEKTSKRLNNEVTMEDFNKFAMEWFEQLEPDDKIHVTNKATIAGKIDPSMVGLIFRYANTNKQRKYDVYEKFKLYFHVWRDHFHGFNSLIVSTFEDEESLTIEFADHSFHIEITRNPCGPDENDIVMQYYDAECKLFEPKHKYIVRDIRHASIILQYYGAKQSYEFEKIADNFKVK